MVSTGCETPPTRSAWDCRTRSSSSSACSEARKRLAAAGPRWPALVALALTLAPVAAEEGTVRQPLPSAEEIAKLPPDGGDEFNRLVFEQSPYLRQHARNPVDWYPWGPEAFERAAAEDKPIFLSIGYSTCHWCHVMEHESFEDDEVAALMNAAFICVKLDREERPDLDQVYMQVTQGMTGRGGWPMTVVMTPEKQPFFAGTYFPKEDRGNRAGMKSLVPELSRAWREEREEVLGQAGNIVDWLQRNQGTQGSTELDTAVLNRGFKELDGRFDRAWGGFNKRPKFPVPHNLRFLLRYARRNDDARALEMVRLTLNKMRLGGIWDHVGFGFHRYSTDREWLVPHFEKMLYGPGALGDDLRRGLAGLRGRELSPNSGADPHLRAARHDRRERGVLLGRGCR